MDPLPRTILAAYPNGHELVDPSEITDMASLRRAVDNNIGDTLFRAIVIEIYEGAEKDDGEFDVQRASELMDRYIRSVRKVRDALAGFIPRRRNGRSSFSLNGENGQ